MIRFILFILCYLISLLFTFAQVKQENIILKNDSIELPGTLSYTSKKAPLIIWVHGSGNVDRNGNQGSIVKANYIEQFRHKVNKHNIAFFSYDKRTANPKNVDFLKNFVFDDLVNDVKTVVNYFKKNHSFSSITLLGHSQGSLVAMLASEKTDKLISLAGPSTSFDETLISQLKVNSPFLVAFTQSHINELKETGKIKEVNPMLASIFASQNQPLIVSWMQHNPSKEIQKLLLPILIVNGDKDLQVSSNDAEALHKAQPNAKLAIIKNMNHVIKLIEKDDDNLTSYYSPDFSIPNQLITTIVSFIKQ